MEPFNKIKDDYDKLKKSLFLCDFVNSTLRELDANIKIFELFLNTLKIINKTKEAEKIDMLLDIFSPTSAVCSKFCEFLGRKEEKPLLFSIGVL